MKRILLLSFIYLLVTPYLNAQTDTEFWFAAPELGQVHGDRPIFLRLSAGATSATVTVSMPANTSFWPITVQVPANSSVSVDLTPYIGLVENTPGNQPQQKGLYITSNARITCYYDIANQNNGDLFALKGSNALGTKFTIPFQMVFVNRQPTAQFTTDFIIVATEDNTIVQIASTANLTGQPNRNFTVTLQKGETFVCSMNSPAAADKPGGSIVTSNKPIAITTKDDSIYYPGFNCQDTAGDQLIPDRLAGTEFILTKGYFNNNLPDYYYIFATENNTTIKVNGAVVATLSTAGSYYSGKLFSINDYIETDKPVQVFQISGFGCEVGGAVIPSIKCTGSTMVNVTRASASLAFYVNVLAPASIINSFTLNGSNSLISASAFQVVPGTSGKWYVSRIAVPVNVAGNDQTVLIENPAGKFHASVIHGGATSTTRFGYFSDFSVNTIQFFNAANPGTFLRGTDTVCYNSTTKIYGLSYEATDFNWTGPNNYTSKDSFLLVNSFNTKDTGLYILTATTQGCGVARDSIRLQMEKPETDFDFVTNGCAGDSLSFTTDPNAGVRWIWDFNNGNILDTNKASIPKIHLKDARSYQVSLRVGSKRSCLSDPVTKTIQLSSKPAALYTVPAVTCVNGMITFSDASTITTGSIVKWRWNLDDGQGFKEYAARQTQQASYASWGKKSVQLVTESETGCISDTFKLASFTINPYPKAGFIVPEVCLDDASALFSDTTSSPDGFTGFTYRWDFNAGANPIDPGPVFTTANLTEKNPAVRYKKADNYLVKLVVDSRGCADSLTQAFTVNGANPVPAFDVVKSAPLCSNDSIRIINQSNVDFGVVTRLEIYWDAADPTQKTIDENPFIGKQYAWIYKNFQSPATVSKTITLKAFSGNASSCSKSAAQTITLLASPKVNFQPVPGICLDATERQLTETSFDPAVPGNYTYIGKGVSSSGLFSPSTADVGTHTILYRYTSDAGCADSAAQTITVWPRPIADFTHANITCEKNPVEFIEKANPLVGTIREWNWNFGDGSQIQTQTSSHPLTHTFSVKKIYDISLSVTTSNGCTSLPKIIPVEINPLPVVRFDLPKVCLPDGKAIFQNQTTVSDNSALQYLWDFGDLSTLAKGNSTNGSFTYRQLGPYNIKLIATSAKNCVDSLTQLLTEVYPQPKARFTATDSVCLGGDILFRESSDPITGTITSRTWDMGNGIRQATLNPTYRYPAAGSYTASHFFTTSNGCASDTAKQTIWIHPYPVISAGPDLFVLDDGQKQLQASASGQALRFTWSPASYLSATNVLQPYVVRPQTDERFTLTVTGRGECSVTDEVQITVLKLPKPPNTFTPNGDGINDVWDIRYLDQYPGCVVEIYSSVGQLVHRNIGYSRPWDGTTNGKVLPVGTYYYVIDPKSGRKKIAGYVVIMR